MGDEGGAADKVGSHPTNCGTTQWEDEPFRFIASFSAEEILELIALSAWEPVNSHAYSSKQLQSLRQVLRVNQANWPDDKLHLHTDALAILTGMSLHLVRREKSTESTVHIGTKGFCQ